jgi:hypothetical protein
MCWPDVKDIVTTQEGVQGDGSPHAGARGVPASFPLFSGAAEGGARGVPE